MRVVEAINKSLHSLMERDPNMHIVGEDILDPYGGAFKATQGLSTAFQDRVLTTPISEGAIAGFSTGMAMKGKPVILEVMFGDFLALTFDQIINHMAKLSWVYNDQVQMPVIIRAPMGGKRGYGSTHSQSIEKHFCGIPGLTVVSINQYNDPQSAFEQAYERGQPTLIIENKILYPKPLKSADDLTCQGAPDAVLLTYGGSTEVCDIAAKTLQDDEELDVKIVDIRQLWPLDYSAIRQQIGNCKRVVVVEEGVTGWGFTSEVSRALIGQSIQMAEVSAPNHPIPSSLDWEQQILPSPDKVVTATLSLFD